jgi:hypothetical protein
LSPSPSVSMPDSARMPVESHKIKVSYVWFSLLPCLWTQILIQIL